MKRLAGALRNLLSGRTTVRFLTFYILLVLLPTLVFINIYAGNLRVQALNEQRYEKQSLLRQSAQYIRASLDEASLVRDTLQVSAPLMTLLECGYPTASDELYAFVTYIEPLLQSILSIDPRINDLYLYRYHISFIGNYGVVHSLSDIADMPYEPISSGSTFSFLAVSADQLHHREDNPPKTPQYVCLFNLFNSDYTEVAAVLELQLDINSVLQPTLPVLTEGQLYLGWGDTYYPIIAQEDGCTLDASSPSQAPTVSNDALLLSETIYDLSLIYVLPLRDGYLQSDRSMLVISLVLLVPMAFFWLYVVRYTRSISKFSQHIHSSCQAMPTPYLCKERSDELGDVIHEYNAMTQTIDELITSMREAERLKNAATYYAMSSQVNPHFMFNTLENIRMRIEMEEYDDAEQMLFMLGRFLRYNISLREESRLSAELEHIQHYIRIYQYRNQNLVTYDIHQDDDVPDVRCPVCMLQPIVENSLKHGIRGTEMPLHISLHIARYKNGLRIDITDGGTGMTDEALKALNAQLADMPKKRSPADGHVGLDNVNARIKYYYGVDYGLSFSHAPGGGVTCHMDIGIEPTTALRGGDKHEHTDR